MYYALAAWLCAVLERYWPGSMLGSVDFVRCRSGLGPGFWTNYASLLRAHLRYTLIRSLLFIKLMACVFVMFIFAVLHGTIVTLSAQFPSPGIAFARRGASTWWEYNLRPHESAAGRCRCRPPASTHTGAIFCQRGLMTIEEFCTQCCKLVDS